MDTESATQDKTEAAKAGADNRRRRGSSTAERASNDAYWRMTTAIYNGVAEQIEGGNLDAVEALAALTGRK